MKSREILSAVLILGTMCHTAAAQPRKKKTTVEPAPPERVLAQTNSPESSTVLSSLIAAQPEMPLGPQDLLKSYEIAMNLLAEKASNDFSVIVQAQQANQITREQAEYLLQQRYQVAMMQYQVLSALHDVLKHDIDEAAQPAKPALKTASSDEVLVVPLPGSRSGSQ